MPSGQRCSHCRSEGHNVRTCAGFQADLHQVQDEVTITRRAVAKLREMFQRKDDEIYDLKVEVSDLQDKVIAQEATIDRLEAELAAAHVVIDTQDTLIDAYAREVEALRDQLADAKAVLASLRV